MILQEVYVKWEQNHGQLGINISNNYTKVYKDDIEFNTEQRKEEKLVFWKNR